MGSALKPAKTAGQFFMSLWLTPEDEKVWFFRKRGAVDAVDEVDQVDHGGAGGWGRKTVSSSRRLGYDGSEETNRGKGARTVLKGDRDARSSHTGMSR